MVIEGLAWFLVNLYPNTRSSNVRRPPSATVKTLFKRKSTSENRILLHLVETEMSSEDEFDSASVASRPNRKQTTKGKQFHVQLLEDQRSSAQRNWRKQLNRIENCLADLTEPDKLQSERIFLESKMEILISAHERLVEALEDRNETCCTKEI